MRKERPPQGIHRQPPELLRRIDQMLDAGEPYSAIRRAILAGFKYQLSNRALSDYYRRREKLKGGAASAEAMAGGAPEAAAASITITVSGPLKIAVVCGDGAEVQG